MDPKALWNRPAALLVVGAALELCWIGLAVTGDLRTHLAIFAALYWAAAALYFVGVWWIERYGDRSSVNAALALAVLFRVTLIPGEPTLSDDIYRYVWDGRVQLHGVNPYRYAPDAPELSHLHDVTHPSINHPEIPTVYPPLMQWVFAAAAAVMPGWLGMKVAMVLFDLTLLWGVRRTLRILGIPETRVVRYAWNPLVVLEVASSGHNDVVGAAFLVFAVSVVVADRSIPSARGLSTTLLGASVLAKALPLALVPLWWQRVGRRLVWLPVVVVGAYLPYLGVGGRLFDGLGQYARRWSANELVFALVHRAVTRLDPTPWLKERVAELQQRFGDGEWVQVLYRNVYPDELARLAIAAVFAACLLALLLSRAPWHRRVYLAVGAVLVLSPTLHPWYLLWVLPLASVSGGMAWPVLTVCVPLGYAAAFLGGEPSLVLTSLAYLPFLAWPALERRLRGRSGGALRGSVARSNPQTDDRIESTGSGSGRAQE